MQDQYKTHLFTNYNQTHIQWLDSDDQIKIEWFQDYMHKNYLPYIQQYDKASANVLEIGCNKGFLLKSLDLLGFANLYGVDLSPVDLEHAKSILPNAKLECADAFEYLSSSNRKYDIIILKAVLEHIDKQNIFSFLEKVKNALTIQGIVVIDVPNMDWLFATHERYMDFTHETGFTQESLRQVMRNVFSSVEVKLIDSVQSVSFAEKTKKFIGRKIIGVLLSWADPQITRNSIWSRSLIGVGKKSK